MSGPPETLRLAHVSAARRKDRRQSHHEREPRAVARDRRHEVRRVVGRRPRQDQARRAAARRGACARRPRRRDRLGDGRHDRRPARAGAPGLAASRIRASSTCSSPPASGSPARSSRWPCTTSATRPSRSRARRRGSSPTPSTRRRRSARSRRCRVVEALDRGQIVLVAGFQGFSRDTMDVTTLGRGGTDATAVALAAALGASCEIYSDVQGVFTADPRIVPDARKLDRVSYEEMLEMSASGAKVLMLRAVEIARNQDVPDPRPLDLLGRARDLGAGRRRARAGDRLGRDALRGRGPLRPPRRPRPTRLGRGDLRGRRRRARERRHDPPERRSRVGRALLLGPAGRRAGDAARARARAGVDRPDRDRRGLRSRQGRARRSGHALAPRRRRADVPHARGRGDQPPPHLDVADQGHVPHPPRRTSSGPCGRCTRRSRSAPSSLGAPR